jgi:hypothetical protein
VPAGDILAFDLGTRCGVAHGLPGIAPASFALLLGRGVREAAGNLIEFLARRLAERPLIVVKEAPLNLQAFSTTHMSEEVVRMTFGLHAVVEGMCGRFDIPCVEAHDATIRRHFTGRGRWGSREATKAAVLGRCWQLEYLPRDCADEDRADACAVFDWCASQSRAPHAIVLFPPQPEPVRKRKRR